MVEKKLQITIMARDAATGIARRIGSAFSGLTSPARAAASAISQIGGATSGLLGKLGQLAGAGMVIDRLGQVAQFAFGQMAQNSSTLRGEMDRLTVVTNSLWSALGDRLAPVARVATNALAALAGQGATAGGELERGLGSKIGALAQNALQWGANVAAEFSAGIVQGASTFLVQAMDFIGNMLTSWLSPGSPPRVAPNIDKWGAAAMNEFIGGFSEADFGALGGLQSSMQTALGALVNLGDIGEDEVGGLMRQLSLDMAGAMDEFNRTGQVGGAVFEKLSSLGGVFGDRLAALARNQFDVAAATRAVEQAQERLNSARKKEDAAVGKIKALKAEYFALRKAGASPEVVRAKLDEIKATQSGLKAARSEAVAAEQAKKEAQDKLGPLQQQQRIQEQLIAQLARMTEAQKQATGAAAGGGGGGAVSKALGGISEKMKAGFSDLFGKLFDPFKAAYDEKMKPAIDALVEKWNWFKGVVASFLEDPRVQGVIEWIKGLFPPGTIEQIGKWAGALGVAVVAVGLLAGAIALLLSPLVLLGIGIAVLAVLWTKYGKQIERDWGGIWDNVTKIATAGWAWIEGKFTAGVEAWQGVWDNIGLIVGTAWAWIEGKFTAGVEAWQGIFENAKTILSTLWTNIIDAIKTAINIDWSSVGSGIIDGVKNGIIGAASNLASAAAQAARDALAAAKNALGIQSPSKRAANEIGRPLMEGLALGLQKFASLPEAAMGKQMSELVANAGAMRPALGAAGAAAGTRFGGGATGGIQVIVQGNVLDDRTAEKIADAIDRRQRMRGQRRF